MRSAIALALIIFLGGCNISGRAFAPAAPVTTSPGTGSGGDLFLYVASGACYGGGVTTSIGLGIVTKYRLDTGEFVDVIADYSENSTTDLPADLKNYDDDFLMVLVENTTTTSFRRVELIPKRGSRTPKGLTYGAGAFSGILRSIQMLSDGSILTSRSSAISKFDSNFQLTATGFINAPGGACATSTTLMADVVELSSGKLVFAHSAASPNNKLGLMSANGTTCLAAQAAPTTLSLPTSLLLHSSGNLLVSYGSTTSTSNLIYSYDINQTANSFTAYQSYSNPAFVNGPSRMVEDPTTGDVYIANSTSTYNNIEKFHYNPITRMLTRAQNFPFIRFSGGTRCISGMVISE
jgi:hypothetical protein